MAVSQTLNPQLCSAWIYATLKTSPLLVAAFQSPGRLRFFQDVSVPTPGSWSGRGELYPFIYWSGGITNRQMSYDRERETVAALTSRYIVRVQARFDGDAQWDYFTPFTQEMRRVLTGIKAQDVVINGLRYGEVWASRWKDDHASDDKDGEARILESGLLIEISHM